VHNTGKVCTSLITNNKEWNKSRINAECRKIRNKDKEQDEKE